MCKANTARRENFEPNLELDLVPLSASLQDLKSPLTEYDTEM
jgi:hypothetical protein